MIESPFFNELINNEDIKVTMTDDMSRVHIETPTSEMIIKMQEENLHEGLVQCMSDGAAFLSVILGYFLNIIDNDEARERGIEMVKEMVISKIDMAKTLIDPKYSV